MMASPQDFGAFVEALGFNIHMMSEVCQVRTVEIAPRPGSLLHAPGSPDATCRLALDCVIAPPVIVAHCWDADTFRLARSVVQDRRRPATLVDIGANAGLFARQMLAASPEFRHAFVYEPHPENFRCLLHNMAPFDQVQAHNVALGPEDSVLDFHLDPLNSGNYSLHAAAMPTGRDHATISVRVRAAQAESESWLAAGLPIFYKSDTQGHDEIIATAIGAGFWDHVFGGIMELWRINKPDWSLEAMAALLDRFAHKRFLQDAVVPLSTGDVLAYIAGRDETFKDLLFWN